MKSSLYTLIESFGIASVLSILFVVGIASFTWVQIGGYAVALSGLLFTFVTYRKKDSPVYWRNWKKNPMTALLFCVFALAFISTLIIALFSRC